MYQNDAQKVLTGTVRVSYCHLTEPHASKQGGDPKYSATILLPKTDLATKAQIDAAINAAIQYGVSATWHGVKPPQPSTPIWDGDGVRRNGEPFGEECKGCWVFTASSWQKPDIVDANIQPILSASDIYSGMYGRFTLRFFPYDNSGNRGVGCGLNNFQKLGDGEPLGGHASAAADFGEAPAPQPAPIAAQPAQIAQAAPQYSAPAINPITGQPMQQAAPQYAPQPQQAAPQYAPQPQQAAPQYTPQYAPQPQQAAPQFAPGPQAINPITGQPWSR